jgi:hypothetical protein
VDFINCDFINETGTQQFRGIQSTNSTIYVEGKCLAGSPCTDWDYGSFTNLKYGIYATASTTTRHVNISHVGFTGNYRAVYIGGMSNAEVTLNNFEINTPYIEDGGYGMYLDNSTGYKVEENNFYHIGHGSLGAGLIVNNSGGAPNEIYLNNFSKLQCGISAQKQNRSTKYKNQGLSLKCNEFALGGQDIIIVESDPPSTGDGIKPSQGANLPQPDAPAGNRFSWTGPNLTDPTDIYNQAKHITYYYHVDPNYKLQPQYYTHETVMTKAVDDALWLPEESCPPADNGGGIIGDEDIKVSMVTSGQKADSVQIIINILKDGGSTADLKWDVDMSVPPETYQVYNELMDNSPYVSDTVMGAALEKDEVLPNVMIRDVMVANPQSAKNDELMDKVDERTDPMPDYMKAQILQGRSLVSVYEELQSGHSFYRQQRSLAFNALVKYYLNDTTDPAGSLDSLAILLDNENELNAKYNLAFLGLELGDLSMGQGVIEAIPQQFNLDEEDLERHQQMVSFYNLLSALSQQGKNIDEADSSQVETLFGIEAAQIGLPSVYARNVLLALGEMEYEEPIILPNLLKSSAMEKEYEDLMKTLDEHHYLKVFPNPAGDYLIVEHNLDIKPSDAYLIIRGSKGEAFNWLEVASKQNRQVVDTKELKPGVYIATLYVNNIILESVKFTKVK